MRAWLLCVLLSTSFFILLQASSVDVARAMGLSSFEIEMLRFYEEIKEELRLGISQRYDALSARCVAYRYQDYLIEMLGILLCDDFNNCASVKQRGMIYMILGDSGVYHGRLTAVKCVALLCEYTNKEFDTRAFYLLIEALRQIGGKYKISAIENRCQQYVGSLDFELYYDGVRHDLTQAILTNYGL
ncbi:MAG: hypothetical protein WCJ17_04090 [bacterium]